MNTKDGPQEFDNWVESIPNGFAKLAADPLLLDEGAGVAANIPGFMGCLCLLENLQMVALSQGFQAVGDIS